MKSYGQYCPITRAVEVLGAVGRTVVVAEHLQGKLDDATFEIVLAEFGRPIRINDTFQS